MSTVEGLSARDVSVGIVTSAGALVIVIPAGRPSAANEEAVLSDLRRSRPSAIVICRRYTSEYGPGEFGIDYGRSLHEWVTEKKKLRHSQKQIDQIEGDEIGGLQPNRSAKAQGVVRCSPTDQNNANEQAVVTGPKKH